MNNFRTTITISILAVMLAALHVSAQIDTGRPTTEAKALTKGEAVRLFAATDFIKAKIGELVSWSMGYDISTLSRAKLVPSIKSVSARPVIVPPDGRTVLLLEVAVDDPRGLGNIAGVRADLTSIGQLSNTSLVDNGLWGDVRSGDGTYSIQTNVRSNIDDGKKEVTVSVANKDGWLTVSRALLSVNRNPTIIWARATPSAIPQGSGSIVVVEISVVNSGRTEGLTEIVADLSDIGGPVRAAMRNDGKEGDRAPNDTVFTYMLAVPQWVKPGLKEISIRASNSVGGQRTTVINFEVKR